MQVAWVTPHLDRSLEQFRDLYKVPEFLVIESAFPAVVFGETGEMKLRTALANVDNMQLELIEPVGGGVDWIYREVLPSDGSHANVMHHVCVKVTGTRDDWNSYVEELGKRSKIAYTGDIGPQTQFIYTDERRVLGHYLEHTWFSEESEKRMAGRIPTYRTF